MIEPKGIHHAAHFIDLLSRKLLAPAIDGRRTTTRTSGHRRATSLGSGASFRVADPRKHAPELSFRFEAEIFMEDDPELCRGKLRERHRVGQAPDQRVFCGRAAGGSGED